MRSILINRIISNPRVCWPMNITEGGGSEGFRIGGMPPINVEPKRITQWTHYFGTFPISVDRDREMELSIFTSFDYIDVDSSLFITKHIHKPVDGDSEVIQCVFHAPSPRDNDPKWASELQAYGVKISSEILEDSEDQSRRVPHKIGGMPFLYPKLSVISDGLFENGYFHLLQWAFPGKGDCLVKGAWPFHDYIFHLYLRTSGGEYECKALLV